MIPILSGNVASATGGGFSVDNSCRFNDGDSPSMTKTLGTPTSTKIGTFSCWVKLGNITTEQSMLGAYADSSNRHHIEFQADHNIEIFGKAGGSTDMSLITNAYYRDPSTWYSVVVAWDTSQGTEANRVKLYVNGTQVTSFATETYPAQDTVLQFNTDGSTIAIGRNQGGNYADGYLAEVVFIDGTQYAASDFGEFDEDSPTIWKPKDVSGLTFGDEGFYCDMEASDNLGNDANGGTDLTESNLAAADQATDTPTNNFCTGNPLANFYNQTTFSEGNCKATLASSPYGYDIGTMGVANGKWYWEIKYTSGSGDPHNVGGFGISGKGESLTASAWLGYQSGSSSTDYGYMDEGGTGVLYTNVSGADTDASRSFAIGNIIGIAIDLDSGTHTMTLYVNGNATTTDNISSSPTSGFYFPAWSYGYSAGGAVFELNFGGCPAFAISSGNADANGYGNFEYAVPSGYYALCTKNLAEFG
jgi:hypothetical protein